LKVLAEATGTAFPSRVTVAGVLAPLPGKDVKVVSVDGTHNAVQLITEGSYNAVIESNPRFGPLAFQTLQQFESGSSIPANVIISDSQYDETNAAQQVGNSY